MKVRRAGLVLAACLLAFGACGGGEPDEGRTPADGAATSAESASEQPVPRTGLPVEYYGGVSTRSSPAGEYLGSAEALMKRVIDREGGMIVDSVLENGRFTEVVMRRTDEPNVMAVEPAGGGYTGTLTLSPDPWDPAEWTYDVRLDGGRRVVGGGRDDGDVRVVETWIVGPDGARQVQFLERLRRLEPSIFEAKRRALVR